MRLMSQYSGIHWASGQCNLQGLAFLSGRENHTAMSNNML